MMHFRHVTVGEGIYSEFTQNLILLQAAFGLIQNVIGSSSVVAWWIQKRIFFAGFSSSGSAGFVVFTITSDE